MNSESTPYRSYSLNKEQIPPVIVEKLDDIERINLKEKIKKKLKQQGAVIVSHYYTDSDLQLLQMKQGVVFLILWIWLALDTNPMLKL